MAAFKLSYMMQISSKFDQPYYYNIIGLACMYCVLMCALLQKFLMLDADIDLGIYII